MRGQKVIYVDKIIGNLNGTILHKSGKNKAVVRFSDEIYGNFQKQVPVEKLYKIDKWS